jgi:hypothetical protein
MTKPTNQETRAPLATRWVLSRNWKFFLLIAVIAGLVLRTIFAEDMEYKEDEEYDFDQSQLPGWPWVGMPSGVYIPNPGMSVWVFKALARLTGATRPTELAHALQIFALAGICLLIPFILKTLRPHEDRMPWLWALALALVNPFAIFYQRKLWPEPFLPFFSTLMLMGWWGRERFAGAFFWGLVGAILGQIHMSGFFFAAGFLLITLIFPSQEVPRSRVHWRAWFAGSTLGALPLIPWAVHSLTNPVHEAVGKGWGEAIQAKFWVFWMTNPLGLHLGNPLGLLRGQTTWAQISDFVRYPVIQGHATYLNALAHLVVLVCGMILLGSGSSRMVRAALGRKHLWHPRTDSQLALIAGFWGFGLLLTLSTVAIRRYYMMVSFPLEFVWLTHLALNWARGNHRRAGRLLLALWAGELFISACFVGYVHVNEGATQGDYGDAYHVVMRKRAEKR